MDDDGESVKLEFGMLPWGVSGGATGETTVTIRDDDDPEVTVAFVQDAYRVVEGRTVTVRITLSADPERTVTIPLVAANQNGASSADYSGVPESVTFNAGETSKTFDFAATDDTYSDTGESVKLTFGALPDRVSEGTPAETTVNIRQVSAHFQLDCTQALWCANLKFDDYTALDWGWNQLQYNASFSPPANLSDTSFDFRGVEYTIRDAYVVPGIYPETDNAYNRVQRDQANFQITISHGRTWEAVPEEHYQDWELHIGGVVLPFSEATRWRERSFQWQGLEFQELFTDWTPSTVNKIGIKQISPVEHLPAVPSAPAYVSAAAQWSDGLRVSWRRPLSRPNNQAITGYTVQWKQPSHSWSDSAQVSSMEVGPDSISAQVNGLTEGVLYTVRVIATNGEGDSPPSADAIGRPQPQSPRLVSTVVSGQTLTLRYNRQLDTNSVPEKSAFVVTAGLGLREVSSVSISGMEVTLTLAEAVTSVHTVHAIYVAPTDASASFLRDLDGNHVYALGGNLSSVTNETDPALLQPLTAQFTNVPSSHDGEDSFTFNIEFSESVWVDVSLGKDHLLRVTGGTVTAAHWLDRRTEEWQVAIQPNADGDITVVLPGGRSCSVAGAPCAAGDRVLSGEKTVTISGLTSQQQAANTPATGAPGISGTARAGETLTATTSAIQDEDGMTGTVFTYQWVRHDLATETDTEIEGATGQTYDVAAEDGGKALKVRVTFTDDAGNEESLTSYAVIASTSLVVPEPMTATTHDGPESHDGSAPFTFELRFSEEPASGFSYTTVRDHTFTVTDGSVSNVRRLEPGKNVRWEITVTPSSDADVSITLNATTDCSAEGAICNADGGKLSGGLTLVVPGPQENSAATGAPTINGTAQVGEALTASTSGISDADGLVNASFTYQWLADETEISGATGSSYTLVAADEGKAIKVTVSFTDDAGNAETLTSAATTAIAKPPLTATVHNKPSSHDGSAAFTFELRLSENIESFSYTTLQDHALTVTGGTGLKVRRLEAGKNVRWEITVTPSSNADVTIALPITTDCSVQGAICTSDGRKLSNRLEVTVSGPGG